MSLVIHSHTHTQAITVTLHTDSVANKTTPTRSPDGTSPVLMLDRVVIEKDEASRRDYLTKRCSPFGRRGKEMVI